MANGAMHVETTPDPLVLRWVVRGDVVSGPAVFHAGETADGLPPFWSEKVQAAEIAEVVVSDGELRVRATDVAALRSLAPSLQGSLAGFLEAGNRIACKTPARDDAELAIAVQELLEGPLQSYVASHGGQIELESVHNGVVTVRLIGACQGCASSGKTLREGIEEQLRTRYPEIVAVRSIEGKARTLDGRKLLPFIGAG